ncbi:MAG: hypothetical protein ACLSVD_12330 [Eggerthellaceae bacterium]
MNEIVAPVRLLLQADGRTKSAGAVTGYRITDTLDGATLTITIES